MDLARPHAELWRYLRCFIDRCDAVIASRNEYRQPLEVPQLIFQPAINPFNSKNREMSETEIEERLAQYKIPTHAPIVVQVSGFDPWKDPESVILAFNIARREVDANLVLLGNFATDDLEGAAIYDSLTKRRDIGMPKDGEEAIELARLECERQDASGICVLALDGSVERTLSV